MTVLTFVGIEAVTTDEAANSLVKWTEQLDISKTGEYWAPRGPGESHQSQSSLIGFADCK